MPTETRSRLTAAVGLLTWVLALLATPAAAPAGTTELVSVDSAGNPGGGYWPAISADGRFVAFISGSTNLVPGDTNEVPDVFVHDRQTGATERVSVDSAGNQQVVPLPCCAGLWTIRPLASISADGRFVAFLSFATNLVPGDTNGVADIFVHDRQTRTTERVSVDSAGHQGDRESGDSGNHFRPALSADGRFVAFASLATNLVPGDTNGYYDVFVRDRQTGTTERVSVDSAGNQGNGESYGASISADGRFVAFVSGSTNLVPGDTNVYSGYRDVFIHDRLTRTTERVSVDSAGNQGNNRSGADTSLSADGRFVAFVSQATNLVPESTNGRWWNDVFVHDRQTRTTERVSVDSAGNQGNNDSWGPAISADGRFAAFVSQATNLVPGDTNRSRDVFVHDRVTHTTERVSVHGAGIEGNGDSLTPSISADGRFVAFDSSASNLVFSGTGGQNVFVHDRAGDAPPLRTNGQPSGSLPEGTSQASLSLTTHENATCRYSTTPGVTYGDMTATFATTGSTAHATPVGGLSDGGSYSFYVRCQDTAGNANPEDYPIAFSVASTAGSRPGTTERVSVDSAGNQVADGFSCWNCWPYLTPTSLSADGRLVAFESYASNLVPGDTNGRLDVFVHDRQTRLTERVSVDSAGIQGNGSSRQPSISADGRFMAFTSDATNLVPGDTNGKTDVFVHDRQTGTTERVSVDSAGHEGNGYSQQPAISADGRFVAFTSDATNLVPGDTNGVTDVFVHDRQTGTTERVSVDSAGIQGDRRSGNSLARPAISAGGRFVAFDSDATNLVPGDTNGDVDVFVHDRETGTTERVGERAVERPFGVTGPSLSADGRFVAFASRTLLFPGDTNGVPDVFVHDRETGSTERVSVDSAGTGANSYSYEPAISANGRFVAFSSIASNLVIGDFNQRADVFIHDRSTGTTQRVSVDSGGHEGNDATSSTSAIGSGMPSISAGGRVVAFWSAATNLVPGDTNKFIDVFVHDGGDAPPPPPPSDTTPPVRSNGQPSGTLPAGTTQATLSLATNEGATCRYSTTPGVAYGAMTATFATTGGTGHATPVGGLSNGGSYTFYVRCQDTAGNANADDYPIAFHVATRVTFDTPPPPGGPGALNGVFQGIDFGTGQWAWEGPYNVDSTNNIYFADSTGTSRAFAFSPAPRVLETLRVFGTRAGTLTLSDDAGQTCTREVATGLMQLVTTGWTRPSTTVTVSFTMGWSLGVDDITYTTAP